VSLTISPHFSPDMFGFPEVEVAKYVAWMVNNTWLKNIEGKDHMEATLVVGRKRKKYILKKYGMRVKF
jgi:hypothetical protein